ncbi:MAG: gas vesicle protein GvpO [Chloroflexales bacterium]
MNAVQIISTARDQLSALTGLRADTVSRVGREGEGWVVEIVMIEVHRIPSTNDILASYHVNLNANGDIVSYLRIHRYKRNEVRG